MKTVASLLSALLLLPRPPAPGDSEPARVARVWHRAVPGDPARPRRAQARFRVARPLCQPPPIRTGLGCGGMPASRCRLDRCDLNRGRLRRCRLKRFSLNRCRLNRCRLNCCRLNRCYSDRCRSDRSSSAVRRPPSVRGPPKDRRPPSAVRPRSAARRRIAIRPPCKDGVLKLSRRVLRGSMAVGPRSWQGSSDCCAYAFAEANNRL